MLLIGKFEARVLYVNEVIFAAFCFFREFLKVCFFFGLFSVWVNNFVNLTGDSSFHEEQIRSLTLTLY